MVKSLLLALALAASIPPASAQNVVSGDAAAGLVSKTGKAEVHLIADPALNDRRLVLKLVVLNLSGSPQPFGPDAVTLTAVDKPIAIASRDALLDQFGGGGSAADETSLSHAAASLPVNGAGQTDVTGFSGSMAGGTAGIPTSSIDRTQRRPATAAAAQLDAVLLKPMTIRPNGADGGQVLTEKLKRKPAEVKVAVTFAGETHLFAVKLGH